MTQMDQNVVLTFLFIFLFILLLLTIGYFASRRKEEKPIENTQVEEVLAEAKKKKRKRKKNKTSHTEEKVDEKADQSSGELSVSQRDGELTRSERDVEMKREEEEEVEDTRENEKDEEEEIKEKEEEEGETQRVPFSQPQTRPQTQTNHAQANSVKKNRKGRHEAKSEVDSAKLILEHLSPEREEGNVEYKWKLVNPSPERLQQLISQMLWRLTEGNGEAIYEIGVADDGSPKGLSEKDLSASLATLKVMASSLEADVELLRSRPGEEGQISEVLVRKVPSDQLFLEVRVAVTGNVDSGKSTLMGVLSKGVLDNGRGLARLNVFRHKHEVMTGRTSDVSREILGFDRDGEIINYARGADKQLRLPSWSEICENSSKVVMFIDLAGHARYLKTTLFGLTGNFPDYVMMVVGANMGLVGMAKEHYHLTLALHVPVFIVVTKIDMCPPNVLEETMLNIHKMLKAPGSRKIPLTISNTDDVIVASKNFDSERIAPIFLVSNVTGESLELVRSFLNLLPARKDWAKLWDKPTEFHIDSTFAVTGVGTVVSGTLMQGTLSVNQSVLLGPDEFGKFNTAVVKSLHTNRLAVQLAKAGQSVAVALKKIKRNQTRKGMVLLDPSTSPPPRACREFEADILIITHSTTIQQNYEAVIHCGATRQTATVVGMDSDVLRSGNKAKVRFRYKFRPEFIKLGERLIFREGLTKGIGKVCTLCEDSNNEKKKTEPHPVDTPKKKAEETPRKKPEETPKKKAEETPKKKPEETPKKKVEEVPKKKVDEHSKKKTENPKGTPKSKK